MWILLKQLLVIFIHLLLLYVRDQEQLNNLPLYCFHLDVMIRVEVRPDVEADLFLDFPCCTVHVALALVSFSFREIKLLILLIIPLVHDYSLFLRRVTY